MNDFFRKGLAIDSPESINIFGYIILVGISNDSEPIGEIILNAFLNSFPSPRLKMSSFSEVFQ